MTQIALPHRRFVLARVTKTTAALGVSLLGAGLVYGRLVAAKHGPGWSEHDYIAWGLSMAGLAMLSLVALPALIIAVVKRRR